MRRQHLAKDQRNLPRPARRAAVNRAGRGAHRRQIDGAQGSLGWWTAKIDEERGGENHPELWLSIAEALGVARETVSGSEPLPATQALVDTFIDLTKYQPLVAGLAALYVYESQTPAVAAAKIDGLRRFYGITSERGLRFFSVHLEADPHHARIVGRLVDHHAGRLEDRRLALGAGRRALKAVWSMLDAV